MEDIHYLIDLSKSLRLSATGEWWHDARPFENRKLIELFNRSIIWDSAKNTFLLQIGPGQASFIYEDTVFFVVGLLDDYSPWKIALSDQTEEVLQPETLQIGEQDQVYCQVKGQHLARFSRASHQALLAHAIDAKSISICGQAVSLPYKGK